MRTRVGALLVVALVVAACGGAPDQAGSDPAAQAVPADGDPHLATAASAAARAHDVPAIGIARVSLDGGTAVGVAGTRSHGDPKAIDVGARFHLGSDTKAMTAVLVAQLVEAGQLRFDTPITDALAGATVDPAMATVTIRDVLGHRSGLVDDFDLQELHRAPDVVAARRGVVEDAVRSPTGEVGGFAYANVNYVLAGVVIEEMTAMPWEDVIRQRLFEPLGMDSCGFGAPSRPEDPLGHTPGGLPVPLDAEVRDNPAALGPAGTVHCALDDWARFAAAMLDLLTGTDTEILTAATATDLFAGDHGYVAGWLRADRSGEITYTHDGSNTLWYARAVLRPTQRDAVLAAANAGDPSAVRAIDEVTDSLLRA